MSDDENRPCEQNWIAIIYSALGPAGDRGGGIHNAVIAQATGLMANGVGVKLLTSSEACAVEARERGIPFDLARPWHSGIDPLFSPRIWQSGRYRDGLLPAAVIHNNARTWFAGGLLFPRALQAQVLHRESTHTYRFFRNWIALSSTYAQALRESRQGWLRRIALAPNGLASFPAPPPARSRVGPITVGTAGRPSATKGTDVLIEAAAIVKRVRPDVTIKIAGNYYDDLQKRAKCKGVSDIVQFVGWQNDIDAFMDQLDVFCLPSIVEPFGLVMIEAMARGLPVIATATNGARDIVRHDETGWLVPINDAAALAGAVLEAAADRSVISRRGAAAYRDVCSRYAPQAAGRNLLTALDTLHEMSGRRQSASFRPLAASQD
ncbi:MAG: glycosyltransferase family 4 protein [Hyphomicrobiaceae bacterium]